MNEINLFYSVVTKNLKAYTFLFLFPILLFFSSCSNSGKERKLPILGNKIYQEGLENDTLYHQIADFYFIDQDSIPVTNKDFDKKVYVADFFFTSCPTICPKMKSQMLRVYETFNDYDEVLILSHTIDPVYDTVPLLKSYAERLGVKGPKWRFVTGNADAIYEIGQESYMAPAAEDKFSPGGFMHSGAFILVDQKRRVRGIYDGTKDEQVDQLIRDIPVLLHEYEVQ